CNAEWYHLAMVVDAVNGKSAIYVDGVLDKTVTNTAIGTQSFSNTVNLYFGASSTGSFFWNGWMDDVRIWSVPMDEAMILEDLATAAVNGSEAGLIAAWDFEDVQGTTVSEIGGQHPGTLSGNAQALDPSALNMAVTGVTPVHPDIPCGRGNASERVVAANIRTVGDNNPLPLTGIKFRLNTPATADHLTNYRLWSAGSQQRLNMATATELGAGTAMQDIVSFSFAKSL
ncbi:MAG: LamG-like jellyroll fold domain-containing protein, partial [Bacteroidota bacterium]